MSRVRRATADDWSAVREVRLAALADAPDAFLSTRQDEAAQPEGFWRARLGRQRTATFLWVDPAERPRGMMTVIPHHDEEDEALLVGVWVHPEARGGGVAADLVEAAVGWARDRGFTRLRLEVGDHNHRAIAFYRRAGFTPTGRTSRFPAPRDHITEHERVLELR